jgi:hypothetical protein
MTLYETGVMAGLVPAIPIIMDSASLSAITGTRAHSASKTRVNALMAAAR